MFTTLLESRAARTRRTPGTIVSALLHGAVIAAAVAITMPGAVDATSPPPAGPEIVYRQVEVQPPASNPQRANAPSGIPKAPTNVTAIAPDIPGIVVPPADPIGVAIPFEQLSVGGPVLAIGLPGPVSPTPTAPGGIVDVEMVERIPRILETAPQPRYPSALRESGISGGVVVRFVVDTLGRAELESVQVLETTHPLFADAVRRALAQYRFAPGETGGRKVRTMVQLPFTFRLATS